MASGLLISKNSVAVIKAIQTAAGKQVGIQSKWTDYEKIAPVVASMVCTMGDLLVDAAKNGGSPNAAAAGVFIVNRAAGFAGLSDNQQILCLGALVELATSVATDGAVLAASTATESGTAGASSPISLPLMIASAGSLSLAVVKANQQCGPLVIEGLSKLHDDAFNMYLQANALIGNPAR